MGDFFFNLTEWLRSTWLNGLALDIEDSGSNWFMVEWFWSVPLAQVLHILAISAGFGATLMLTLRVSGMAGQEQPLAQYSARFVPWIWWSLAVIVFSGLLMAWAEPVRNIVNAIFWTKMVLMVLVLCVSLLFQRKLRGQAATAGADWVASGGTRATAWVIVILWCMVMAGGRWIAYAPV